MKIVGVIPARYGSTRLPGKPLLKIAGRELLAWVIDGVKASKKLTEVYVATDHEEIANFASKLGVSVVMTEADIATGTDRIWQAIKNKESVDIVVNIQGDEPLVTGAMIDSLIEPLLHESNIEMSTLATEIKQEELLTPHVVKVITNSDNNAIYFSRFPIPYSRVDAKAQSMLSACYKHIGMYAYRFDFLKSFCEHSQVELEKAESLEQLRALYMGAKLRVVHTDYVSHGVDTQEDIKKVETYLEKKSWQK